MAVALALAAANMRMPANATTTSRIVTDPLSGLAISGFDPVAYFTDQAPRLGEGAYELSHGGAVWRFCNPGNRAAFKRDPEIYAPRFGGYDPIAVAQGASVPGHPLIWLIAGDRLYLFSEQVHRDRFAAAVTHSVALAEHRWPEVEATLFR